MCSSPVSTLADIFPEMIHVPGRPTDCAEVVAILLATLRQPECERFIVSNLWDIYTSSVYVKSGRHKQLLSDILEDLPHDIQMDIAREVSLLNDEVR